MSFCKKLPKAAKTKKLVLVLPTSALLTSASEEAPEVILDLVL